jgi:hypothetical protein
MNRVLVVLASLVGLIAATAAATTSEGFWVIARAGVAPSDYARVDDAITAACASAAAGLIVAVLLTSRLPRAALVVLGLFSTAMLAVSEYLRHQSGTAGKLAGSATNGLLLPLWERIVVPYPAFALLAVALIWVGLTRRPVVTFAGFPAATVEPRRPFAAGLIAVLLGALVWAALGLAVVAFDAADGRRTIDWSGVAIDPGTVRFGSLPALYLVGAAGLVVGGGLFAILVSRRLHASAPVLVGVLYLAAVVACLVGAMVETRRGFSLSGPPLLAALELGVQVMAGAPGALLAVPLITAGIWRIRADQSEPTTVSYATSNDPTIPLY